MKKLGRGVKPNIDEPNEEQRALLPSSRDTNRCSSLGFGIKEPTTEILVEMLSELIVEVFFYESNQNRE